MTESLRLEVRPFAIRVVVIEPGGTRAEITQNRSLAEAATGQQVYGSLAAALNRTADDEPPGPGPDGGARLLWRVADTQRPKLRNTLRPATQRAAGLRKRLLACA